jgi:hypothetical protein
VLGGLSACQPKLDAGDWTCPAAQDATAPAAVSDPVAIPWSTSFEQRFCDYSQSAGFCYGDSEASYSIVTTPVHSGRYAAAFSVNADDPGARQARCVRQGTLPTAAYYGAWYFIPALASVSGNWNLWFFQGGEDATSSLHGLWNVTLVNGSSGDLELIAYTPLGNGAIYRAAAPSPIPIGSWFHIQFFLKRARDASGQITLYQDDALLFDETNLVTDDSSFGQWYVGNLSDGLTPPDSTLYVDDVSISATR